MKSTRNCKVVKLKSNESSLVTMPCLSVDLSRNTAIENDGESPEVNLTAEEKVAPLAQSLESGFGATVSPDENLAVEDKKLFGFTLDEDALKDFDDKDLMAFLESEARGDDIDYSEQFEDLPIYEVDLADRNPNGGDENKTASVLLKEIEFYLDMQHVEIARRLINQLSEGYDSSKLELLKIRCEKNAQH